ncbi:TPA: hypothetical protein NH919_006451 [Pseudomonas aeruginosa]|nr:hypothetical protein [Pseudomonas aeruginosa]HCF6199395.1 hypothetical protein [Pseudomonas aeruginosa]
MNATMLSQCVLSARFEEIGAHEHWLTAMPDPVDIWCERWLQAIEYPLEIIKRPAALAVRRRRAVGAVRVAVFGWLSDND